MLTPTGITSSAYWDAIKAGNPTHVRITFTGRNIVLSDDDISIDGIVLSDILNGNESLVFGKCVSKQATVAILNSSRLANLAWVEEFKLEFGVDITDENDQTDTYWVTIGYFTGESPKNVTTVEQINLVAFDRMKKFDIPADKFVKKISYPTTLQNIYNKLCDFVGIQKVAGNELPNAMSRTFDAAPVDFVGYKCKDVLAWIAEACGCYARINSSGKCQMVWFTDNTGHLLTGNEEFDVETVDLYEGMTWDEADQLTWDEIEEYTWDAVSGYKNIYGIDQITVKQVGDVPDAEYPNNFGQNVYLISENPFLPIGSQSDINNYLAPIFDRISNLTCFPIRVNSVGCWLVEAGDIITIEVNGNNMEVPVFMKTMTWNGAVNDSYETTAQENRDYYPSAVVQQQAIINKNIRLAADNVMVEATERIDLVVEEIEGEYYKKQSGISIEKDGVDVTGSKYVDIHSGGRFSVDADGFSVDSDDGFIEIDGTRIDNQGFHNWDSTGGKSNGEFVVGSYGIAQVGDHPIVTLRSYATGYDNMENIIACFEFAGTGCPGDEDTSKLFIGCDYDKSTDGSPQNIILTATGGQLGEPYNYWEVYGNYVHYTYLVSNSSKDVKHDIRSMENIGDKIDKLRPVTFIYNKDKENRTRTGLIYEEAVDVMPEICVENKGEKAINYMELVPMLLKEIQDLRKRIDKLEKKG